MYGYYLSYNAIGRVCTYLAQLFPTTNSSDHRYNLYAKGQGHLYLRTVHSVCNRECSDVRHQTRIAYDVQITGQPQ